MEVHEQSIFSTDMKPFVIDRLLPSCGLQHSSPSEAGYTTCCCDGVKLGTRFQIDPHLISFFLLETPKIVLSLFFFVFFKCRNLVTYLINFEACEVSLLGVDLLLLL